MPPRAQHYKIIEQEDNMASSSTLQVNCIIFCSFRFITHNNSTVSAKTRMFLKYLFKMQKLLQFHTAVSWTSQAFGLQTQAQFILSANANAIRMLTSQILNETCTSECSTLLRISQRKKGCDVKFTSNLHRIRIHRKYEPGLTKNYKSL